MEGSYIPKGTKIIGDVYADGDLELDGDVIGNVNITGNLDLNGSIRGDNIKVGRVELSKGVIESDIESLDYISVGKDVTVIGNIKAVNADIDGAVEGDLDVKEKVAVGSTAVIKGDLIAGELAVDFGALCDVNLEKGYNQGKASAFFDNYLKENPQ